MRMRCIKIAALVLLLAPLSACASKANTMPPVTATVVGYWLPPTARPAPPVLVKQAGSDYFVAVNGNALRRVSHKGNVLTLEKGETFAGGQDTGSYLPRQQLILAPPKLTFVTRNPKTGEVDEWIAMRPVTRAAYDAYVAALFAGWTRSDVDLLADQIDVWASKHGSYPIRSDLRPDSAFGRQVADFLTQGVPTEMKARVLKWPYNVYVHRDEREGAGLGDFTYTVNGHSYTLVGHLPGGKSYTRHS